MPLNPELHRVMIIGSGPIVIGQAAEFDYAGSQACRALKDAGLVLPGENSATRTKRIGARTLRVLYIPRHLIDGGDPPPEQTGFEAVDEKW